MHKKFKYFMALLLIILSLVMMPSVYAASFKDDIEQEVSTLIEQGKLESWHENYSWETGYQVFYTKVFKLGMFEDPLTKFSSYSEEELSNIIRMYRNSTDSVWDDLVTNLDIEPYNLEPNKIVGLYWDSSVSKHYSFLYLIWTTEYFPTEFVTLKEITINDVLYKQYDNKQAEEDYLYNWEDSDHLHYSVSNLSIHKTAIAGFYNKETYGKIPLTQKYHIKGFKAGIDEVLFTDKPDPNGLYSSVSDHEITFDLGITPKEDGKKAFQIVTHAYEIIKDVEVQSYFDALFGGYNHKVVFNTTIDIDRIYRVDVSYILSSENKKWYEFYLNTKEEKVQKSLTAERVSGGLFNLFKYQGFKEGVFQSNIKNSKTYKYQLHLNYDDDAWNFFETKNYYEADYKVIKDFEILRLNYLVDDKVYDVAVKMDTVDGDTLGIFDKDLILDTDSTTWKIKDKVNNFIDDVKDSFSNVKNIVITIGAIIIILILIYIIYKFIRFINDLFKTKRKD